MSERRFDIVFSGKLVAGADPQRVRQNVAELFKIGGDTLDTLFSGERVTVKKGVDRATAVKYQQAMTKAGAVIQLVLHQANDALPTEQAPEPSATNKPSDTNEPPPSQVSNENEPTQRATETEPLRALPAGSDMLTASERQVIPAAAIDTAHLQTESANDNPFLRDDADTSPSFEHPPKPSYPSPSINASTGNLELGELGASSGQPLTPATQSTIDTSHLSASPTDTGLLTTEEREQLAVPPTMIFDLDLTLSEAGENLLDDSERTPERVTDVDTSRLSVEKPSES